MLKQVQHDIHYFGDLTCICVKDTKGRAYERVGVRQRRGFFLARTDRTYLFNGLLLAGQKNGTLL